MNGFYQFTTKIKDTLKLDPFVNTVTYGDIFQVDLSKQTIFPLSHLVVNNVTKESNVMRFNISILAMDIVDMTKDETTDIFIGNDNTHDIWNTQLKVLDRLTELLRRGSIVSDGYQLDGNPTFEQFTERFENYLAGWTVTFDVIVANDMTICVVGSSGSTCSPAGYLIKDSAGNTLYNGSIASGEVGTITVEDSTVENSDASYSASILAEGSLVLPDITINVQNSALTVVNTATVASVQDVTISAPDGTINIKKTGDGTIASFDAPSGAITDYSVADNAITVNSANSFTIDATDPLDIVLKDSNGSTLTPNSVTPNSGSHKVDIVLPANVPPVGATLLQTGQTVSFATGDDITRGRSANFTTLSSNNPFGNTNRFTSTTGNQTYSNGIVIDWSTYNGTTVLCYYIGDSSTYRSYNDSINLHLSSTFGGLTNWKLWNVREVLNVCDTSKHPYKMNYAPFNFGSSARYFITNTDYDGSGIYGIDLGGVILISTTRTNALLQVYVRVCTVTGTTLS